MVEDASDPEASEHEIAALASDEAPAEAAVERADPEALEGAEHAETETEETQTAARLRGVSRAREPLEGAPPSVPRISKRTLGISAALVALVSVIGLDIAFILRDAPERTALLASASAAPALPAPVTPELPVAPAAVAPPQPSLVEAPKPPPDEPPAEPPKAAPRVIAGTVEQAARRSCFTGSVDALSRQIIRQTRCIDPAAFVPVPERPNLAKRSNVFLYMAAPARDHLLKALDANRNLTMTVNSSLRTVAQQYLLWRWYTGRRCGIRLASRPGDSNHETGLALDIAEAPAWRSKLEAHRFKWLGAIDNMHFDYVGPGASSRSSVDVKAFQQLWNLNHPEDRLKEDGLYSPATEARLKKSPAGGFPKGSRCGR
ncbi:MAG: M15 family metallopeptidase [Sorangiineae bacterium]|nr:M15 family metallopeptidase [Polyangiaceae bacterium]MEB2321187.1 M15 family metallopeptidase [Sorangiineae bacterium]